MKTVYLVLAAALAGPAGDCVPAPSAVTDIDANSYYSDDHHSVIDPQRRASTIAGTRPVEDFLGGDLTRPIRWNMRAPHAPRSRMKPPCTCGKL